ncbi:unnamed protein product [Bursaphelenchus okinawaensis]|uniref:RING-type domain-containing protein n=1 Tax=Bursaphelenchus okinawaensis TaxID=465554 RepID=A0A811JQ81_9BILA|nr:unnamed protein product [Bursaphelenchus okinawaensis]CAG9077880.1 unnamed protein product [Bursaphelenchus okinawaensis]
MKLPSMFKRWFLKKDKRYAEEKHNALLSIAELYSNKYENILVVQKSELGEDLWSQMGEANNEMMRIATSLLKISRKFDIKNDNCRVCLEDEAIKPVFCLQCLKTVSCEQCFIECLNEELTDVVKCLNCQRKSPKACNLFAGLEGRKAKGVHKFYRSNQLPYRLRFIPI